MPLLGGGTEPNPSAGAASSPMRRQSQLSNMAKSVIISSANSSPGFEESSSFDPQDLSHKPSSLMGPPKPVPGRSIVNQFNKETKPAPSQHYLNPTNGIGQALTDTPLSTAPSSPQMQVPTFLTFSKTVC